MQGVQLLLEVREYDGLVGAGDLVGRVVHDIHSNLSLGVETTPSNFSYRMPPLYRSSIVLSFKVVCAKNYYGQDCSRYCNESCTCDPGFTGEFCHEIDDCQGPGVACGTNQRCIEGVDSYTCVCSPGYTGDNCDINIDECQTMSIDCGENGQCIDGLDTFTCSCDAGYTGEYCEVEINECEAMNITCSGHGQCVDEEHSYSCVCDPNFTGETCSEVLDETQVPSKNLNLKAILGGTIGLLVFLVISLLLVVGAMAVVIRGHKKKGE